MGTSKGSWETEITRNYSVDSTNDERRIIQVSLITVVKRIIHFNRITSSSNTARYLTVLLALKTSALISTVVLRPVSPSVGI